MMAQKKDDWEKWPSVAAECRCVGFLFPLGVPDVATLEDSWAEGVQEPLSAGKGEPSQIVPRAWLGRRPYESAVLRWRGGTRQKRKRAPPLPCPPRCCQQRNSRHRSCSQSCKGGAARTSAVFFCAADSLAVDALPLLFLEAKPLPREFYPRDYSTRRGVYYYWLKNGRVGRLRGAKEGGGLPKNTPQRRPQRRPPAGKALRTTHGER